MPKLKNGPGSATDHRLLEPGWAGELAPDEFEFVQAELVKDKKLAFAWGFRPGAKRRAEWAIRQVAYWGDPEHRTTNAGLARNKLLESYELNLQATPKEIDAAHQPEETTDADLDLES